MFSDDTEHTVMVLRSLIESPNDPNDFQRRFARRLKRWMLAVPAGAGMATVKACLRLLAGVPPSRSGVGSAGNGAAMRSAIIGACFGHEPGKRRAFTHAASVVTHTDRRAIDGAHLVALAAATPAPDFFLAASQEDLIEEWRASLRTLERSLAEDLTPEQFASLIAGSRGVSGFVMHSVPVALFCWLRHPESYRECLGTAISLGGDTDTVAAIAGGIIGAHLGIDAIPLDWREGMVEWPLTLNRMLELGAGRTVESPTLAIVPRNALFLATVLLHGFRRMLPPYG